MQIRLKKILSLSVLILGVVFLAGCGASDDGAPKPPENTPMQKKTTEQKTNGTAQEPAGEKNANLNNNSAASADSEESLLTQEESEAQEALSDVEDLNDLANTYDENNL